MVTVNSATLFVKIGSIQGNNSSIIIDGGLSDETTLVPGLPQNYSFYIGSINTSSSAIFSFYNGNSSPFVFGRLTNILVSIGVGDVDVVADINYYGGGVYNNQSSQITIKADYITCGSPSVIYPNNSPSSIITFSGKYVSSSNSVLIGTTSPGTLILDNCTLVRPGNPGNPVVTGTGNVLIYRPLVTNGTVTAMLPDATLSTIIYSPNVV